MRSNFLSITFNQISTNWVTARRPSLNALAHPSPALAPRLLCVLAHPDDEALCLGGTLAKYAAQGVEIALVVATRGERGWRGSLADDPGPARVGQIREAELRESARVLGIKEIKFLDYVDGQLVDAPFDGLVAKITRELRRFRPDVVVTFDAQGMYGHPDHIAVSQATNAALISALDPSYLLAGNLKPHRVQKLYHRVFTERALGVYQSVFGELRMQVGQGVRTATPWESWAITTQLDATAFADIVWNAIAAHRSQLAPTTELRERFYNAFLSDLSNETFYRVVTVVNSAQTIETDLLEGVKVAQDARGIQDVVR